MYKLVPFLACTVRSGNFIAATWSAVTLTVNVQTRAVYASRAAPGRLVVVAPVLQDVRLVGYVCLKCVKSVKSTNISKLSAGGLMGDPALIRMTVYFTCAPSLGYLTSPTATHPDKQR